MLAQAEAGVNGSKMFGRSVAVMLSLIQMLNAEPGYGDSSERVELVKAAGLQRVGKHAAIHASLRFSNSARPAHRCL